MKNKNIIKAIILSVTLLGFGASAMAYAQYAGAKRMNNAVWSLDNTTVFKEVDETTTCYISVTHNEYNTVSSISCVK